LPAPFHHHTLWTAGDVRCELVTTPVPLSHAVQVVKNGRALYAKPVLDPEDAAHVAEHLWRLFVEAAT
jgi:hypothetical protein